MNLLFLTLAFYIYSLVSINPVNREYYSKNNKKNIYKTDSLSIKMAEFFKKEKVTILITDSGLGGLSVCADIENKLQKYKIFKKVNLVFFNAQPKFDLGYNRMKTKDRKIKIFNNALEGMVKWYNPDIVLIACNTLSVLYDETDFSKKAGIPVVSIVNFGVDMIYDKLSAKEKSEVIIFGTETTIAANSHKSLLVQRGIDSSRIITQPCKDLAGKIESDSRSEAVKNMIGDYSKESASKLRDKKGILFAGLCCTHYGYCSDIFQDKLKEQGIDHIELLDPNYKMSDFIFPDDLKNRFEDLSLNVEVVSRIKIMPEEINSIGSLIKKVSANTYKAFEKYKLNEDLFIVDY